MKPFAVVLSVLQVCSLAAVATSTASAETKSRPNIVFLFSDDLTCQAVSAYGEKRRLLETPHMDRIARKGMRFDRCLVTNSICGSSQATILTGKYSHLNGFYNNSNSRFDPSQQTFPKLLQAAGYAAAVIGKWHLVSDPTGFGRLLQLLEFSSMKRILLALLVCLSGSATLIAAEAKRPNILFAFADDWGRYASAYAKLDGPQRAIRTHDFHYIINFKPDRWPLGDPYRLDGDRPPSVAELTEETRVTLPDEDAGPTKAWLVGLRNDPQWKTHFHWVYGKRPREELYDLKAGPQQTKNVSADPAYAKARATLNNNYWPN